MEWGQKFFWLIWQKKHDTIGIDAIAMVVNDCLRSGAKPIALTDIIDIKKSEPKLLKEIQKGLIAGAKEAGCPIVGGEIADLPELLNTPYYINCDCFGQVEKDKIITGEKIKSGNIVIGFASSGIHSNGLTLARKILFKKWGGTYDAFFIPEGFKQPLVFECLEPTKIYVKPFLKVAEKFVVLAAVHITGDAYLKFKKLINPERNFGFEFFNFKPQPIFKLIQETGKISFKEMARVFNLGWGFAMIVDKSDEKEILKMLERERIQAEVIGKVISEKKIIIKYQHSKIVL
jgi:phosphoribosylformylglycinamidine cyclo-ligase